MVALRFTPCSAAQPDQTYFIRPLGVIEVDVSSMFENIFAEGDTPLSPWWPDVATPIKVRPSSDTSFSFLPHGE